MTKSFLSYYHLTKPGIVYGNAISLVAGFVFASKYAGFNFWLLLATLFGVSLVIGSACVFNNIIDRDIDVYMVRTQQRALVKKIISPMNALLYGTILGLMGFFVLYIFTNLITVIVGVIGFLDYVVLYGYSKRRSIHSTLIGSVSGATPILAGYVAVSTALNGAACWLFLAMVFWQMPHFYVIAIRRLKEYKAAGLAVLPVKKGIQLTKVHILAYSLAFMISAIMLTILGYTSWVYFIAMLFVGTYWLNISIRGFWVKNNQVWAKRMFVFSLIVLLVYSFALIIDSLIFGKIV